MAKMALRRVIRELRDAAEDCKAATYRLALLTVTSPQLHDAAMIAERQAGRLAGGLNELLTAARGENGEGQLRLALA